MLKAKKNENKKKESAPDRKNKKQMPSWLVDIRYGRSLSVDFFRRNAWFLMVFVVAMLSLIGLRYKNKTKMMEIKRLNTELKQAESAKLQEKAAYMSLIRESEMKRLVEKKGLGLQFQEQPPYEVELEND